jgi:hypothetical protein
MIKNIFCNFKKNFRNVNRIYSFPSKYTSEQPSIESLFTYQNGIRKFTLSTQTHLMNTMKLNEMINKQVEEVNKSTPNLKMNEKNFAKSFNLTNLFMDFSYNHKKVNLEISESLTFINENLKIKEFVAIITKELQLQTSPHNNKKLFENIKKLYDTFENEFKTAENKYVIADDILKFFKFLNIAQYYTNNSELYNQTYELIRKYLNLLDSLNEIPIEIVKSHEPFLFNILENYINNNSNNKQIPYNSIITKFISSTIKYSGDKNLDQSTLYFFLSYYYLKLNKYQESEEYIIKCMEILKSNVEDKKDFRFLEVYFILGEINSFYYKDLKESYLHYIEAEKIILAHAESKSSTETQLTDSNYYLEILKLKIFGRLISFNLKVEDSKRKKIIEYTDYVLHHMNINILKNNQQYLKEFLTFVEYNVNALSKLNLSRNCYDYLKILYNTLNVNNSTMLATFFENSTDSIYLNRLLKTESYDSDEFLNYMIRLFWSSTLGNLELASNLKNVVEQIYSLRLKSTFTSPHDDKIKINYSTALAQFYLSCAQFQKAVDEIKKAIEILEKSETMASSEDDEIKNKLIHLVSLYKLLGEVNLMLNLEEEANKNFELCLKNSKQYISLNPEKSINDLIFNMTLRLAQYYQHSKKDVSLSKNYINQLYEWNKFYEKNYKKEYEKNLEIIDSFNIKPEKVKKEKVDTKKESVEEEKDSKKEDLKEEIKTPKKWYQIFK